MGMYVIKETTKQGVEFFHGPFVTIRGAAEYRKVLTSRDTKTVVKNMWVPDWNENKSEGK
jgi:hypothetical protein